MPRATKVLKITVPYELYERMWADARGVRLLSTEEVAVALIERGYEWIGHRIAARTAAKFNWDDAPENAQWWAVDANGEAWWFVVKPVLFSASYWDSPYGGQQVFHTVVELPLGVDWRLTLQERPK